MMFLFHEALWVTLMSFASVSLRYIPFHRWCGQARGEQLRSTWYWAFLVSIGTFLWRESRRFPDPSKRMPDSFRVSLPYYINVPAYAAVWLSYFMTAYHLQQFRSCRRIAEEVVDLTFDVLLLPVSFGLLALHCIRILPDRNGTDLWGATATLDAAEVWESWALWSFQSLFIRYVEGSEDARGKLYGHFEKLCLVGVQQYVVFNFATNAFEFVWREVNRHDPELCGRLWGYSSTCEEDFHKVEEYLVGALWYSCTIAIFSIVSFERALSRSLQPIDPVWKFWGAKLIVSIAGIQRLGLFALTKLGAVAEVFAWFLHAYLLCFETLLLSALHFRAYPASGYFKFGSAIDRARQPAYGKVPPVSPQSEQAEHADEDVELATLGRNSEDRGAEPDQGVPALRPTAIGRSALADSEEGERLDEN